MGLGITAHTNVEKLDITHEQFEEREGEYYNEGAFRAYVSTSFPDQANGMESGYYKGDPDYYSERISSYHGYNEFREELSKLILYTDPENVWERPDAYEGKPFFELINFSDAEGTIGPETSAKLAKDFQEHREKAEAVWTADRDDFFNHKWEIYQRFQKAFELAAENGCVTFG